MPRRPDMPCASCGRPMWRGRGSRPEGKATCRSCRAESRPDTALCAGCNQPFTPTRSAGGWTKACSQRCDGLRRRALNPGWRPDGYSARKARERVAGLSEGKRRNLLHAWQKQGRPCAWCAGATETVDHVVPLFRGGTNYEGNLTPSCRSCNSSRSHKTVMEWRMGKPAALSRTQWVVRDKAIAKPRPKPTRACAICTEPTTKKRCCSAQCAREYHARYCRERYRAQQGLASTWHKASRPRDRDDSLGSGHRVHPGLKILSPEGAVRG
jgi:hypothetical protein